MEKIGRITQLTETPWLTALLENEKLRGIPGVPGEPGPAGADGADGKDGVDGRDGAPGVDGKDGVDGLDGLDGQDGADGKDGRDGKRGLKGERGLRGFKGDTGRDGKDGKDGEPGKKGDKGDPPRHQVDMKAGKIRFERPDGTWGAWIEIKQKILYEGGGGGIHPQVRQDIEAIRAGKYPDYSRVTIVTADTTLTDFHRIVVAKTNALTITLPPAATYFNSAYGTGIIYTVKNDKSNTNDITVAADGAELADDANTWTIPPGAAPKIVTDGTKWHII